MKRSGWASVVLSLSLLATAAHALGQDAALPVIAQIIPMTTNCPISVKAELRGDVGSVRPLRTNFEARSGQALRFNFESYTGAAIQSVRVTVHGVSNKGHLTPASLSDEQFDFVRQFTLKLSPSGEGRYAANLSLPGYGAVGYIRINSVTYAQGPGWSEAAGKSCDVRPLPPQL